MGAGQSMTEQYPGSASVEADQRRLIKIGHHSHATPEDVVDRRAPAAVIDHLQMNHPDVGPHHHLHPPPSSGRVGVRADVQHRLTHSRHQPRQKILFQSQRSQPVPNRHLDHRGGVQVGRDTQACEHDNAARRPHRDPPTPDGMSYARWTRHRPLRPSPGPAAHRLVSPGFGGVDQLEFLPRDP